MKVYREMRVLMPVSQSKTTAQSMHRCVNMVCVYQPNELGNKSIMRKLLHTRIKWGPECNALAKTCSSTRYHYS